MVKLRKDKQLLLGAHISIAGGLEKSIIRGENLSLTCIQIFTKSNRQWKVKNLTEKDISLFTEKWKYSFIKYIIAHASYLINLGSPEKEIATKSTNSLAIELERCEQLKIPYLVFHPGSRQNMQEDECLKQIAYSINEVIEKVPGKSILVIENMAGQGSNVCYNFQHLAQILKHIKIKKRVGICFDTCHAFAAGYDFRNKESYENMWKEFNDIIGIKHVKVIHLNDSQKILGSHIDRHESIGKGKLGKEAFDLIMNDKNFIDVPKILETPVNQETDYSKDLRLLIKTLSPTNRLLARKTPLKVYFK